MDLFEEFKGYVRRKTLDHLARWAGGTSILRLTTAAAIASPPIRKATTTSSSSSSSSSFFTTGVTSTLACYFAFIPSTLSDALLLVLEKLSSLSLLQSVASAPYERRSEDAYTVIQLPGIACCSESAANAYFSSW